MITKAKMDNTPASEKVEAKIRRRVRRLVEIFGGIFRPKTWASPTSDSKQDRAA